MTLLNEQIIFDEIVDKNFDIEDFDEFMRSQVGQSVQVSQVPLERLKEIIKQFQEQEQAKSLMENKEQILLDISQKIETIRNTQEEYIQQSQEFDISQIFSDQKGNDKVYEIESHNVQKLTEFFKVKDIKTNNKEFLKQKHYLLIGRFKEIQKILSNYKILYKKIFLLYKFVKKIAQLKEKKILIFTQQFPNNFQVQKIYLETFLQSLLENPFLKNSRQIVSFLKDKQQDFLDTISSCNAQNKNKNLEMLIKKKNILPEENFFTEIIKNLPSFVKNIQLINSEKLRKFSSELPSYLVNYYQAEKSIVSLSQKLQENLQNAEEQFSELLLRVDDLNIMESLGNYFGLPCTQKISSSNKNMKNYFEILKRQLGQLNKFFSSQFFQYLSFRKQETCSFLKLQKESLQIKKKVLKIKSELKKKNLFTDSGKQDIEAFDSYLNYINYQNFKISYRQKNNQINFKLLTNYQSDMNFFSQQFDELEKLKTQQIQVEDKKLASSILVSHNAIPRSNTEQILWQSVIPQKKVKKIDLNEDMSVLHESEIEDDN